MGGRHKLTRMVRFNAGDFHRVISNRFEARRAYVKGSLVWGNSDGALIGSYTVKAAFTMDQKTNAPKGTVEGTWEIADGTNHFATVRGHGIVKGEFNGTNEIDHWNGTITGFEKRP